MPSFLASYEKLRKLPFGRWLFSRGVEWRAPYFASIRPQVQDYRAGYCEVRIADCCRVHNHIGTVHAIALCNLAELCGGVMTDASLPPDMRWIPKGMTVSYLKKAQGRLRGIATPEIPIVSAASGYDLPVNVDVLDAQGERVFNARILMWLSPRR